MSFIPQSWKTRRNWSNERKVAALVGALLVIGLFTHSWGYPNRTMLILRGIAAENAPRGQLDDTSAKLYALKSGYGGLVLDVAGATSEQMQMTLAQVRNNPNVTALYGFSGGAYSLLNVWNQLTPMEKFRIQKIVIVGAPGITEKSFPGGIASVVIQEDPPEGHLNAPRALLRSWR
jgi:hypothetical protein